MTTTTIHQAPLQGFTDHIWRNAYATIFGGIDCYYSSFLRVEHGEFRRKDIRDILPENNGKIRLVPQILACLPSDAALMAKKIIDLGYSRIDINLGCPFPPIARKNRGAGMLAHPDMIKELFEALAAISGVKYSVKMRAGMNESSDWKQVLPLLDIINPVHVTLHPRIGAQQYKGEINMIAFDEFYSACQYPIIYNGDITSTTQIKETVSKYPKLNAVMIGRGLLYDPSMLSGGNDAKAIHRFHSMLHNANKECLEGGDHQVLAKMLTYWEYLLPNAERALRKKILKSTTLVKYSAAVEDLFAKL